ncbi:leucine-rich repeat receptor-like serine/threonine-protein kinase BAM1 [Artemisia annua]|uniref:Leucine-rich repeat receptor-like serine/threonine-protein kinase BAM1 n=1 Tax=Artemisia annua TaxID=35608 RepID=A0A2U1L487_ARTAN|nr:leucine-rich repeat receptor-like serine/threonine-protein kinase BAM1 [Artemisia annua]
MQSLMSVDFSHNNLSGLVPGHFSYLHYTLLLGNAGFCRPYLGPFKNGVMNSMRPDHSKGLSASVKLLLVIGLLVCSIAFAVDKESYRV